MDRTPPLLTRRHLLAGAASAAAYASLGSGALAKPAAPLPLPRSDPAEAAKLNAVLEVIAQRNLRRTPEDATRLGIDVGDLAWTRTTLTDFSPAALDEDKAINAENLKRLHAINRSALAGMDAVNYDTVEYIAALKDEAARKFAYSGLLEYGAVGAGQPYVISQLSGSYQSTPDFLDTQHVIENKGDADAYLARMEAFGRQMDQECEVARRDQALGVIPPDFIIDKALIQMREIRGTSAEASPLVGSLVRRATSRGLPGDWSGQASRIYEDTVLPALQRQIELLEGWRPNAVHDAGVWRLKDGADYYATSLKQYTTTGITPDEVHQTGLDLVTSLSAQIDTIMRGQGLRDGTVGERLRAMYQDPKYRYPNTDEGKVQLIADLNEKVKTVQAKLPAWFGALPKASVEIHRVPKATEAGAPGGYYSGPPIDGSRPGIYWINLRNTAEKPRFVLPTLTFHEAIPGHHLQGALSNEAQGLPLIRKLIWFSGYGEGWALYAEQLAVEMGMYDNDPLGHVGQLHDSLFRAVRLVVDSGMHDKRWSREQAVKYYSDTLGDPESGAITEVERYCVWPGQASSYMVGKITFLRLRDKARLALGKKFDLRAFHDAVLLAGVMPLAVMERRVDDYIAAAKA